MLSSCAAFYRMTHADKSPSCPTPSQLCEGHAPLGILEDAYHPCSVPGPSVRRLLVYLPADYYSSGKSYPTVYMLHGARGNESSWIVQGNITATVDSLTSKGLMEPSIIVMPNMNQYSEEEEGLYSYFKTPFGAMFDTDGAVETAFVKDVTGYVDSHYRTIADKEHRAIAGLSLGSLQTMYITAANPDVFDYIGLFSPIMRSFIQEGDYDDIYSRDTLRANHKLQFSSEHCPRLYYIHIGRQDCYIFHSEYIHQYMHLNSYRHEYKQTPGAHDWPTWRRYAEEFLQRCFK